MHTSRFAVHEDEKDWQRAQEALRAMKEQSEQKAAGISKVSPLHCPPSVTKHCQTCPVQLWAPRPAGECAMP